MTSPPLVQSMNASARTAAGIVFGVGTAVLLGWTFHLSALKSIFPHFPAMVPNTALGFIAAAISLWLLLAKRVPWKTWLGRAAGLLVLSIGCLTLIEHLMNLRLPVDQFLFQESVRSVRTPFPGRPSFLTALNFLFLGFALLLRDAKRVRAWVLDLLILIPIQICLLALIGYACSVPAFYGRFSLAPNTAMALHTTLAFIVFGTGLLCARPERGLMKVLLGNTTGGVIARRLLLAPVIIPLATGLIRIAGHRAEFYNPEIAGWLFSFANIFIFTAMIWWIAVLLHRTDATRRLAEEEVRQLNANLEQRVAERTSELQLIFDTVPAIIFYKDLQHRLVRINQAAAKFLGAPKEKIEGCTDVDMGSPHAERYYRDDDEVVQSGQTKHCVIEPVQTARGTRWLQTDKLPYRDPAGQVTGVIGFALDITERREADRKIREQVRRLDLLHRITHAIGERQDLRSIFQVLIRRIEDDMPVDFVCVCTYDAPAEVLTISNVGSRIEGRGSEIAGNEQARIAVDANDLFRAVRGEFVYQPDAASGAWPFAQLPPGAGMRSVVAAPLLVEGNVFGVLIVAREQSESFSSGDCEFLQQLTEHVALAIHQAQLQAGLAERVRERTSELEAANEELEAFSYSISHDLRAPLRAVSGFSSIVLQQFSPQIPADAQRFLKEINASAHEMGRLIDGLLEFSRLGRHTLARQPLNLAAMAHEVIAELRRGQPNRKIEIRVQDLPECIGDPLLLKQVFVNLLSNAFKFTRHTENAVVEIGHRQQGSESVYFVRDNGAGFDMQYAGKLFGVFQRLHRNDEFEGTGVGLSIVQRIIHRHGGRIWAESEVNKGAVFNFTVVNHE